MLIRIRWLCAALTIVATIMVYTPRAVSQEFSSRGFEGIVRLSEVPDYIMNGCQIRLLPIWDNDLSRSVIIVQARCGGSDFFPLVIWDPKSPNSLIEDLKVHFSNKGMNKAEVTAAIIILRHKIELAHRIGEGELMGLHGDELEQFIRENLNHVHVNSWEDVEKLVKQIRDLQRKGVLSLSDQQIDPYDFLMYRSSHYLVRTLSDGEYRFNVNRKNRALRPPKMDNRWFDDLFHNHRQSENGRILSYAAWPLRESRLG